MINCIFDPKRLEINVYGHACYAEKGADVVCAAVSSLVYTLANAFGEYEDDGIFTVFCTKRTKAKRAVFDAVIAGLRLIAYSYPKNFRMTEKIA